MALLATTVRQLLCIVSRAHSSTHHDAPQSLHLHPRKEQLSSRRMPVTTPSLLGTAPGVTSVTLGRKDRARIRLLHHEFHSTVRCSDPLSILSHPRRTFPLQRTCCCAFQLPPHRAKCGRPSKISFHGAVTCCSLFSTSSSCLLSSLQLGHPTWSSHFSNVMATPPPSTPIVPSLSPHALSKSSNTSFMLESHPTSPIDNPKRLSARVLIMACSFSRAHSCCIHRHQKGLLLG